MLPLPDLSSAKVILPAATFGLSYVANLPQLYAKILLQTTGTMGMYRIAGIHHTRHEIILQGLAATAVMALKEEPLASVLAYAILWSVLRILFPKILS